MERGGYAFEKYRFSTQAEVHIGVLKTDSKADGFTCTGGRWAHFKSDWSLEACFLAEPYAMAHFVIPSGAWIKPHSDRLVAALPDDTACQGYICAGSGGAKGIQSVFYTDGRLKAFFPREQTTVSGVLCKATPFANIQLYQNGALKSCVAATAGSVAGAEFKAGDTVELNEMGSLR